VNLGLSVVLVNAIGPIGPAISTLVVIGTDDLVVIPLLASTRLQLRASAIWSRMAGGYLVGAAIVGASLLVPTADALAVVARVAVEAVLLGGVLWYLMRPMGEATGASEAGPSDPQVGSDRSL
jgi:hypothetical protein